MFAGRAHAKRRRLILSAVCTAAALALGISLSEATPVRGDDGGGLPSGPRYPLIVHRGANLPPPGSAKPVPLVIGFHGTGGSPQDLESLSGLDAVADEHGFVVAYLSEHTPTKPAWLPSQQVEDIPYVKGVIKQLIASQNIDPRRVYATGFSAGATMSYAVGCTLSGTVAGIAVVSGAMRTDVPCSKIAHPVSQLLVIGTQDAISYTGGPVTLSVDAEQTKWRTMNRCGPASSVSTNGPVTTTLWSACDDQSAVELNVVQNGRHQWPGSSSSTGPDAQFQASEAIWSFFAAHPGPEALAKPSADVTQLAARATGARRWITGLLSVREARVTAAIALGRTGAATTARKSFTLLRGTATRFELPVPATAPGGRYTVRVTLSDTYGRTTTLTRSVSLPK